MREDTVQNGGQQLYEQLGALARFVENAIRAVSQVGAPIMSSSAGLPMAASHLAELNKMTEDGTLEVIRLTEMIQESHGRTVKELDAIVGILEGVDCPTLAMRVQKTAAGLTQDDHLLMQIMTALSFQDLVAQRVKKLVTILNDVQNKLMELVVVFGLQPNEDDSAISGKACEMLKQLEQSRTSAMKQDVADEILAQFGFK